MKLSMWAARTAATSNDAFPTDVLLELTHGLSACLQGTRRLVPARRCRDQDFEGRSDPPKLSTVSVLPLDRKHVLSERCAHPTCWWWKTVSSKVKV